MGVTELGLYKSYKSLKGVFSRSYCCYGNLLNKKNDRNLLTTDGHLYDTNIVNVTC